MPIKPQKFEFKSYTTNLEKRELLFTYSIHFEGGEPLNFTERLVLPEGLDKNVPPQLLENILQGLHLILGISYYKLYVPGKFKLPYKLSKKQAKFWNTVYRKGLGEFLYRNNLDPKQLARFEATGSENVTAIEFKRRNRVLSAIGGGKDSIVSTELLREGKFAVTTLYTQTQKPNQQVTTLLKALRLPSLTVERYLDEKIFQKHEHSYNGHIPVSAIFAFIGTLVGILYDHRYLVVANERSSNFGNIEYHGEVINHQWSKSEEFEKMFQEYTRRYITPDVTYFSLLRHSNEIRIAKLFSKYPKYFKLFSSCNRVAKINPQSTVNGQLLAVNLWCGECAKCAFTFAILSPFIPKKKLIEIFGKDLFADKKLDSVFADISGKGTMKPFDCVGTFEEVTAALYLARRHPERSEGSNKLVIDSLHTYPAPLIPAQFGFLGMKKALILGYGREGKVTKQYLKKCYPNLSIGIADQVKDKKYLEKQINYDIAIKTPGLPKEKVTIFYTTATNIFLSRIENTVIGVTGSKGKSTTAALIYAILTEAKKPAVLLGNIGVPMLSYSANSHELAHTDAIIVLELSSYMLDDIQMSPHIAVVTNLFPEHMNYHGTVEKYYEAKKNIIKYQRKGDYLVFNPHVERLSDWIKEAISIPVPSQTDLPIKDSEIPLLGVHNRDNVRAAVTVARLLHIPDEVSERAIKKFKGLAHRLEFVGEFKGIKFYDDAISTTPESTIEAIKSLQNIGTIFLGGEDRGYDFAELGKIIRARGIKNIVLFPDSGNKILKATKGLHILKTTRMKKAVAFAYQYTKSGEICLLSTASPSYSLWKNFEEKGNQFVTYIRLGSHLTKK